ncbi:13E12 repeat family protein [Microbacterium elymi]|uniref:13E12 repeat family protein n=1 Tax=Microbacterium elymi TaxID=2909587 RepID=A0ABY5NJX7_9MICO|nr:13E12 repeat family protein [Microbacterium elymi]UUT35439.1 13E12 repeat family protein [Microbacterium elymi]
MNADLIDAEAALAEYDEYAAAQGGADWGDRLLRSGAAHERGVDALETATRQARIATAEQYALCGELLADARAFPDPWCGPDPTTDPDWVDPRERTAAQVRASRVEFAERAAVADLAVRIRVSERTVRAWADTARTLQERCPVTWRAFRAGRVDERNADTAASLAGSLPADDRQAWERFDQAAADAASRLPAGKFRTHARALRERVHPEGIDARHRRAARDRATWLSPELDGMATYSIYGPAAGCSP